MSLPSRIPTSNRVALAVTTVLLLGVVALSLVAYVGVSHRLAADTDRALSREAEAYGAAIGPSATRSTNDLVSLSRDYIQARTGAETATRPILLVRFASGKVLSNSQIPIESAPGAARLLDVASAERRFADVEYKSATYRVAVVPVSDPTGEVLAVFEAALSKEPAEQVAKQLAYTLAEAGLAIVLLGAALSAFVAQASLRPLRRAAKTASEVTMASLGRRIDYDGADDEVGQMVRALNAMLARLEASFDEQRHFVADASHELRTPLAIVHGHLELLAGAGLSPEDRDHALGVVFAELERMNRLVDDLLALARLDAGGLRERQPLELATLVTEAAARGSALCECRIETNAPRQVWADGDPDGLLQAVLNLVKNAAAVTPADGTITVSAARHGGRAVIEVADTGPGIRAADLPRIFDRFYRAHGPRRPDSGGSGLGLAIVKRLVELHGGTVAAFNCTDGGALFRIKLAAIDEPGDAAGAGAA